MDTLNVGADLSANGASVTQTGTLAVTDGAAAGGPTRTEVLVTTSLEGGSRYLARTADVYYIAHHDALLYLDPPPPPPVPLVPMKTWRMVTP